MGYFDYDGVVDRAENHRIQEVVAGIGGDQFPDGVNKEVFLTQRNTVGKIPGSDRLAQSSGNDTREMENFPWATLDIEDLSDIGLEHRTPVIDMRPSNLSHEEAVDTFGLPEVIDRDVGMFFDILQEDKVYGDLKPQNIGYFQKGRELQPEPVDVFDIDNMEPYKNDPEQVARALGLYIRGNEFYDGIADKYDIPLSRAEKYVFESAGLDREEMTGRPFKDIKNALGG